MQNLTRNWWVLVGRGGLAILFGLIAFLWPNLSFLLLILTFGAYALADGVFAMLTGMVSSKYSPRWWMFLLEGVVSFAAGLIAILMPDLAAAVLVAVLAAWAIVTGALEITAAIRLRREITNEWMLALGGFASIALGIVLFFQPAAGGLVLTLLIGAYALVFGILLLGLGLRLRKWAVHPRGSNQETIQFMR